MSNKEDKDLTIFNAILIIAGVVILIMLIWFVIEMNNINSKTPSSSYDSDYSSSESSYSSSGSSYSSSTKCQYKSSSGAQNCTNKATRGKLCEYHYDYLKDIYDDVVGS